LKHGRRKRGRDRDYIMKALILYVVFVAIGGVLAATVGYYVEMQVSAAASLMVFLALFFANFAISWIAVILIMDGSLRDAQGRQSQLDIEKSGRAGMRSPARPN
jgi:hypothetical protein